jgi:hypothetical protein
VTVTAFPFREIVRSPVTSVSPGLVQVAFQLLLVPRRVQLPVHPVPPGSCSIHFEPSWSGGSERATDGRPHWSTTSTSKARAAKTLRARHPGARLRVVGILNCFPSLLAAAYELVIDPLWRGPGSGDGIVKFRRNLETTPRDPGYDGRPAPTAMDRLQTAASESSKASPTGNAKRSVPQSPLISLPQMSLS